jgi:hypothetical protein
LRQASCPFLRVALHERRKDLSEAGGRAGVKVGVLNRIRVTLTAAAEARG